MGVISKLKEQKNGTTETKTPDRSDDAAVKAECAEKAKAFLELGMDRADVLKTLQKKFVGLPVDAIEACMPAPPKPPEEKRADEQKINPPDLPKGKAKAAAAPRVEDMAKLVALAQELGLKVSITISA